MPVYSFKNKQTGETWEDQVSIAEMEAKLAADKNLDVIPGAVFYGDSYRLGITKPDNINHFREVIDGIKKRHPLNTIDGTWH